MKTLEVVVKAIRMESETVHSFEFAHAGGDELPGFAAGAHIDVHMKGGMTRSYSLLNDPQERHRYVIAVNRENPGRGGSAHMHAQIRVGQHVFVSEPRNNFELFEDAEHTVLMAGGIGVTPLLAMIKRLDRIDRPWTLHYCGRSRATMAYLGPLEELKARGKDVRLHIDSEAGGFLDIAAVVAAAPAGSHLYCCGPGPMLGAFEAATAGLPGSSVHVEYFAAKEAAAADGGFVVELARSGRLLDVVAGQSILDTLLDAGVPANFSCMGGICGLCEIRVLEGLPDHRDSVLSSSERDANDRILVCCSGSRSAKLVLDI